jgi:hypothetical protein
MNAVIQVPVARDGIVITSAGEHPPDHATGVRPSGISGLHDIDECSWHQEIVR